MISKAAAKRLGKEASLMEKDPPPLCYARPRDDDLLEWHFILRGPPGTPYEGGEYWGQLLFPEDYPFKPPGIKLQTPSGRFEPDTKICTSMSDYHPGSWNPAWSVASILIGLLSFMCTDEMTAGSVMATPRERRLLAAKSHAFNISQRRFAQLFPDYMGPMPRDLPNMSRPASVAANPAPPQVQPETPPAHPTAPDAAARAPVPAAPEPQWSVRHVAISAFVVLTGLFAVKLVEMLKAK
ncbi:Similar to S.cerevisiae protein UBC6 (Ubiquitin-conjugating enzyme involved in ERAD) [Malassezia sympodialis ATCC 42132]|uniref:Similar to S.cerevisiae protein UBC6 (Ubiquitin-conjugating enzyme involved in ERAD) n=1 Tax=Malassezia sympodialis (strain ATCC 42132) TaxID=1230383 RepID=A0A1M8A4T1_MALS4|nr:Similar to S.cerevisiae protein UBC6 (Ubiquitin-conjugating enzyme involved in ERAD) [Malassezia sympodialis ATCC 42132]